MHVHIHVNVHEVGRRAGDRQPRVALDRPEQRVHLDAAPEPPDAVRAKPTRSLELPVPSSGRPEYTGRA